MIYTSWILEDRKSIIYRYIHKVLIDIIIILIGLFWKDIEIIIFNKTIPKVQIFLLLLGTIMLIISISRCIIKIIKVDNYKIKFDQIINNGQRVIGRITKVKSRKDLFNITSLVSATLYSAIIEYKNPYTSAIQKKKTPFDYYYLEYFVGCECELYILDDEVALVNIEEISSDEDFIESLKKGDKIPATIIEAHIEPYCDYVVVKYKDPETNDEKKHIHEVDFDPKRLEDNKCTLYKQGFKYYLEGFKIGDKNKYTTDKRIKFKNSIYNDLKKLAIILVLIFISILVIYIWASLNSFK